MEKPKLITDIFQLVGRLPQAAFLQEYVELTAQYQKKYKDIPVSVATLELAARMVKLSFDPAAYKALGIEAPECLMHHPTIDEIYKLVTVGKDAYIDLIASVGKTHFSFDLCYEPDTEHQGAYLLFTSTKLIDGRSSGLSRQKISKLLGTHFQEIQAALRQDSFLLFVDDRTGDLLLRGGIAYEPYIPINAAVEMAFQLVIFMTNLIPEVQKAFSKARPDSFWFAIDG